MVVDLPDPFSPTSPRTSPGLQREADLVQHLDAEEALAQALDAQHGVRPA